ncbi:hypothetical protein EVAR_48545_1 [Eumeta japonica]|uniref:Uncharacterized protein n=1 Tax=Eumeta variegata TaxID=151549 RepID=A0A4C1Y724_EUMVA|nr:hypothetical protein EVAR_48545_1 [Eumeta japonica]
MKWDSADDGLCPTFLSARRRAIPRTDLNLNERPHSEAGQSITGRSAGIDCGNLQTNSSEIADLFTVKSETGRICGGPRKIAKQTEVEGKAAVGYLSNVR